MTFEVNIHAVFYLAKAAVPHMKPGSAIINTASVNSDMPNPILLAYATTKGAIQNFTGGLAQMLAEKGIRVNAVAPGPIWTPHGYFSARWKATPHSSVSTRSRYWL
jgi:NAD(P)-dependent dehydrogenase (short-subunit alcohol dehydrogenase family)